MRFREILTGIAGSVAGTLIVSYTANLSIVEIAVWSAIGGALAAVAVHYTLAKLGVGG